MARIPSAPPKVQTKDHELAVMSRMADLYALLALPARHRVHHYMGERLESLPTLAAVGPAEPEAPVLPFHRDRKEGEDAAAAQAAS